MALAAPLQQQWHPTEVPFLEVFRAAERAARPFAISIIFALLYSMGVHLVPSRLLVHKLCVHMHGVHLAPQFLVYRWNLALFSCCYGTRTVGMVFCC